MFKLKRAYQEPEATDGLRYLVDRLWPRGVAKASLQIEGWVKDVAPSGTLRQWFNHDPAKWTEFRRRYSAELDAKPEIWAPLTAAARRGIVTLIYAAHDTEHNNAAALAEYLEAQTGKGKRKTGPRVKSDKIGSQ